MTDHKRYPPRPVRPSRASRVSHPSRPRMGAAKPPRSEGAEPLGSVLQELTAGRPWIEGLAVGELGRRWAQVVGERLAGVCRPVGLQAGILVVKASTAAWAAQLRFLSRDVAARANEALGGDRVKGVKLVVEKGREG